MPKSGSLAVGRTMSGIAMRAALVALVAVAVGLVVLRSGDDNRRAAAEGPSVPAAGLDFSMGVDTDGDTTDDCSSSGTPTNECGLADGEALTLKVYLNSLADKIEGYEGIDFVFEYAGVAWTGNRVWVWPDGVFCAEFYENSGWFPGAPAFGCTVFEGTSTYTGLMVTTDFTCDESGTITMLHGLGYTTLKASPGGVYAEGEGTAEALTIVCGEPPTTTPAPTATPGPLYGDVGCDGLVNSRDALLILQYHAALIDSLPCLENADVNGDGRVNSIDAALTIQYNAWDPIELPPPAPTPTPCAPDTCPTPTATLTPGLAGLLGDVDCNDSISATDALLVLQYHRQVIASLPCPQNADVNRDGHIDSVDAALIIQYSA